MGRRNKAAPQRLNEEQQRREQWNLLDQAGHSHDLASLLNDNLEEEDEDDADFVPQHQEPVVVDLVEDDESDGDIVEIDDADGVEEVGNSDDEVVLEREVFSSWPLPFEKPKKPKQKKKTKKQKEDYGGFSKVLKNCQFYAPVVKEKPKKDMYCLFAKVQISLTANVSDTLPNVPEFWIYVSGEMNKSAVYFEWHSNASPTKGKNQKKADMFRHFMVKGTLDLSVWDGLSKQSIFQLVMENYNSETRLMDVWVYLKESRVLKLENPSEFHQGNLQLKNVVEHFYGISAPSYSEAKETNHNVDEFYQAIRERHNGKEYKKDDVQHPSLLPQLRPYQKAAVQWMLYKEQVVSENMVSDKLHTLYEEITSIDGTILYYNKYGGYFVRDFPCSVNPNPGGILADEMGLGKTVEVLCCMLCHPRVNVPMPEYLEPIQEVELTTKKRTKKSSVQRDIITLAHSSDSEDKDDGCSRPLNETTFSQESNDSMGNCQAVAGSSFGDVEMKETYVNTTNSTEDKIEESAEDATTNTGRPKRRAARKSSGYESLDLFDFLEEEEEEDYTPQKRTGKGSKKAPKRKSDVLSVEEEINSDQCWSSIESAIIKECWEGKEKDYKKEGSYKEFKKFIRMRRKDPYYMMTLKERLSVQYESSIAEYCGTSNLKKERIKDFFNTRIEQKSYFECICGSSQAELHDTKIRVQCSACGLWQHAECVEYNVSDPYRGKYICPHCWTQHPPVSSGATLIVAPASISNQWVEEIQKHLKRKSIRMLVYKGVSTQGYIQPQTLASFDIVISSYETLSHEVNYVDLPHSNSEAGRRFRHPKRFMATPSPLPCVEWWRVCLDEAQMVECTTTKTAEMALRLTAINRWCVTGTPIQKTINDLQGLLMFLGIDPYWAPQWWQRCLYDPYCHGNKGPLFDLMVQCLWRNAKHDVIHQIDIPPQTEEIHWLTFTPVEEHFYRRLHTECSSDSRQRLNKFSSDQIKLSSLDRQTLNSVLHPLLKLRQACNHPQVVRGQFVALNRKTMTMEQLLEDLIRKTKVEAEDAHRSMLKSMNGLAGIHIIKEEWAEAVSLYREVLQLVKEREDYIKTDTLQRLHTFHNLSELLDAKHEGIPPTLRDDSLKSEAVEIKDKYMKKYPARIKNAKEVCEQNTTAVMNLKKEYILKNSWWLGALESFDNDFVMEVREELLTSYSRFQENKCLLFPVETKMHLQKVLQVELKKMETQRKDMLDGVKHLNTLDPAELLHGAIDCHLRPTDKNAAECLLCATHSLFEEYEETLFFMKDIQHSRTTEISKETETVKDDIQIHAATRRGNWGQSETERVLRYLQTKSLGRVEEEIYQDSQNHIKILDAMKKEFKNCRIWWRTYFDQVSGMDEVNMATLRLRLRYPDEQLPDDKNKKDGPGSENKPENLAYKIVLEPIDVPVLELKFKSERIVSQNDFRVKLGQLLYLQNLQKADFGKRGGSNPEVCPVCQSTLGEKWCVLQCGHSYCHDCVRTLSNRAFNGTDRASVSCPMCRQKTRLRDVSHIDTRASDVEEDVKVQGSLSTKIEGVVRLMLRIKAQDPEAKVLVFSSWTDVLDVIADGLAENGIMYRSLHQHSKFQTNLTSFKSNNEITALLMPIKSGANGLNLIGARHVVLVEPILNPAAELQAIGRVHRIGQTHPTVVHRFLVQGTIEERMHQMLHHRTAEHLVDENTVTLQDLKKLFTDRQDNEEVDGPEIIEEDNEIPGSMNQ
ncbi:E3 ubiquitin-protein ligase SHPRH [Oratosquilla oratoria]|uniref:E3 ubiquitin-protein ligase SHPRH n=1 Tax=Oratosquilla oratoria TaxID=337810 RepID=UPI003F76026A